MTPTLQNVVGGLNLISTTAKKMRCRAVNQRNLGWVPLPAYGDEFYTPPRIVQALGSFDLDPCAGPMKHAERNLCREDDGLSKPWEGRVWMNPPYSEIESWIERFIQHGNGIAFVNARPDTQWFQALAAKADAVLWLRGRVHCLRPEGVKQTTATVGSVLVAYGERNAAALLASGLPGVVMTVRHCTPNPSRQDQAAERHS